MYASDDFFGQPALFAHPSALLLAELETHETNPQRSAPER
jgi:hypothetical protein